MRTTDICPHASPSVKHEAQCVGVEIEAENASYTLDWSSTINKCNWQVTSDGSLRGDAVELISPPATISAIAAHLPIVYKDMEELGARGSLRTGTHVHFDMLDKSFEEIGAICTLYALIEPLLYSLLPPDREECIYCVPWYRAPNEAQALRDVLDASTRQRVHRILELEACKYTGLNLQSLRNHGTIEFRMAPTFETSDDLVAWIKMLNQIVQTGVTLGNGGAVLRAVSKEGLDNIWTGASTLAERYDSYYVAEIIAGKMEPTWEAPLLDFDATEPAEEEEEFEGYFTNASRNSDPRSFWTTSTPGSTTTSLFDEVYNEVT